jgi:hypothetical protein
VQTGRRTAEPLVVAGLAAHGSVVGLTAFSAPPPLLTALVATLVFAGISLVYGRRTGALVGPPPGRRLESVAADAVVLGVVVAAPPRLGGVPSRRARAPVDRSVLRVVLGTPVSRREHEHDVPRETDRQRRPHCPWYAGGRAGGTGGGCGRGDTTHLRAAMSRSGRLVPPAGAALPSRRIAGGLRVCDLSHRLAASASGMISGGETSASALPLGSRRAIARRWR